MSFKELKLIRPLLRAVADQGYKEPTPIQRQAIPVVLQGRDVLGGAQTGTGKTAGFTLPLLQLLYQEGKPSESRHVRVLVVTPTRELAAQVEESIRTYGKYMSFRSSVIYGGVKDGPQIAELRRGVDILVATPGRLLDLVSQRVLDLSMVSFLVLDEADRMLDMGFIHDIKKILALLPKRRQNLLFSATFSDDVKRLADNLLNSPVLVEVCKRNTVTELVTHRVHPVDRSRKRELLSFLIRSKNWKQVLVFTRTKHGANQLAKRLCHDGIKADAIHGNKSQPARMQALSGFKDGTVRVLVATDIAARGLDIDQLPHVVNFDLPNIPEDYVHRIGRTGRAGRDGEATSLVCVDERILLEDIEKLIKRQIPQEVVPGFEPDPTILPEPIKNARSVPGAKKNVLPDDNRKDFRSVQRAGSGSVRVTSETRSGSRARQARFDSEGSWQQDGRTERGDRGMKGVSGEASGGERSQSRRGNRQVSSHSEEGMRAEISSRQDQRAAKGEGHRGGQLVGEQKSESRRKERRESGTNLNRVSEKGQPRAGAKGEDLRRGPTLPVSHEDPMSLGVQQESQPLPQRQRDRGRRREKQPSQPDPSGQMHDSMQAKDLQTRDRSTGRGSRNRRDSRSRADRPEAVPVSGSIGVIADPTPVPRPSDTVPCDGNGEMSRSKSRRRGRRTQGEGRAGERDGVQSRDSTVLDAQRHRPPQPQPQQQTDHGHSRQPSTPRQSTNSSRAKPVIQIRRPEHVTRDRSAGEDLPAKPRRRPRQSN
eukprot:Rmarinus@m.4995